MFFRTSIIALAIAFAAPAWAADCQSEIEVIDQYMTERQSEIAPEILAEATGMRNQAREACNAGEETTAQALIAKVKQILTET